MFVLGKLLFYLSFIKSEASFSFTTFKTGWHAKDPEDDLWV